MIIILEPQKDTYVTNLKTQNNDASLANVGHAATLDLFKLYNENKHSKSWSAFKFNDALNNNSELKLIDVDGNEVTFIIKTDVDTEDGSTDGETGKVIIGVSSTNNENTQAKRFATVINNVSNFNNGLNLKIKAYNNSNNELVLKQDKSGELGDTVFELPTNMVHVHGLDRFARIDYSNLLIKFDLENFKKEWDITNELSGAFSTLKAELVLKDVTTGISKPKEYSLELLKLMKDFDEGIGKDTIHFSDSDTSNFINLTDLITWEIQEYISNTDAAVLNTPSEVDINIGNEDLVFNITEYIKNRIVEDPPQDKGFLVKFSDDNIYDEKSYFVKRLGSRHLINKKFVPQLRIKIDDSKFNIPTNSYNKVRYLDNEEDFYLFNRVGSKLINFVSPNETDTLKFRIKSKDKKTIILQDQPTSSKVNFSGNTLNGVKTSTINLSKFNKTVIELIENNKIEVCYEWYWLDQTTTTVKAGNFIIGKRYKIKTSSDTSFTSVGADDNEIGTIFTATGEGSGSDDAFELIEKKIVENNVIFFASETFDETKYENLITSIRITENDLFANNSTNSVEVYFVDTKKEFNAVKVPYELPSEDIGDVFYQIYDIESGNVLVDYDVAEIGPGDLNASSTKMFYDGEKYKFNLFVPKLFKNLRVNFKFKYKDPITNVDKFIFNEKYSVRII